MDWTLSTVTVIVLAGALIAVIVGVEALRQRPDPVALPLSVTMFAVVAWAIPHALSLGFTSPTRVEMLSRLQYPGAVLAPVAYLVLALRYAGFDRWLSRETYAVLAVIPLLTLIVAATNPVHGLLWRSYSVTQLYGATVLLPVYGPWYWLNLGYLYLVTAGGLLAFATVAVTRSRVYRKQASVMFFGGFIPLVVNGLVNSGIGPEPMIDFTTTALALSGLTFALALFRLNLLDIRPVARSRLFTQLDDGVIVVGPEGHIRDFNSVAERIFGELTPNQPVKEVLSSDVASDGGEIVAEIDGTDRYFRTRQTRLTDQNSREVGRILYLNDITDLIEREQRISVLNRILRHNISNELTVTSGRLEFLQSHVSDEHQEHVQAALESTHRVIDSAQKARHIEHTLTNTDELVVVSATATIEDIVTEARDRFQNAAIEYTHSTETDVSVHVVDERLFRESVTELIENAVIHTDRDRPEVTVTVEVASEHVQIRVADRGPGIPEQEVQVLSAPMETRLEHGSGLGLWLVEWTASLSSGSLSFAENEGRGTVATLRLPLAE